MNNQKINNLIEDLIILASKQDCAKTNYLLSKFLETSSPSDTLMFYLCDDCESRICEKCYHYYDKQSYKDVDDHSDLISFIVKLRTLHCP